MDSDSTARFFGSGCRNKRPVLLGAFSSFAARYISSHRPRMRLKRRGKSFLSTWTMWLRWRRKTLRVAEARRGFISAAWSISMVAKETGALRWFIRIHRSALVNPAFVEEIHPYSDGGIRSEAPERRKNPTCHAHLQEEPARAGGVLDLE